MSKHKKQNGFTLTELLVTVGIILVLLGLAIPGVMMAKKSARVTEAKQSVSFIKGAIKGYEETHSRLPLPIAAVAPVSRYAHGLIHGAHTRGLWQAMQRVGIDEARLKRMTEGTELEQHVTRLKDHPVLYVEGVWDKVDPAPSLERLEAALEPTRSLHLEAGHGTLFIHRARINRAFLDFFGEQDALQA